MTVTLLLVLAVRLVIGPVLRWWLTPAVDPTAVLFHLAPGEVSLASVPARRRCGWSWQPGTIVVTDRRIWFVPLAWNVEPSSMNRSDVTSYDLDLPAIATLARIRNWPEHLRIGMRSGSQATFAVADPRLVVHLFQPGSHGDKMTSQQPGALHGAFDA
jgi:hypothetical protein